MRVKSEPSPWVSCLILMVSVTELRQPMHSGLPETFPGETLKVHSGKSSSPEESMADHALAGDNGPELLSPLFRGLLQRTGHLSHWGTFSPGQCMNLANPNCYILEFFLILPCFLPASNATGSPWDAEAESDCLPSCKAPSCCRVETYKYPASRDPHMT